jgi:7-cyano-7-deazaguanine synthase
MHKGILLSGGIDSISLAYWKRPQYAFTINYGQKPAQTEIRVSKTICDLLNIQQIIIDVDCQKLGSGDLVNKNALKLAPSKEWWPYRNQLLATLSCMKAVGMGIEEIMIASVRSDGFHKDGTSEFFNLLNSLVVFQEGNLKISAPAIHLTSKELVIQSRIPAEILYYAHSCHTNNIPCGHCGGCYKYVEVIKSLTDAHWNQS